MKYHKINYKYVLEEAYACILPATIYYSEKDNSINTPFIRLFGYDSLLISKGYKWDGCSGPTIDTAGTMEASLVHDALYQLTRLEVCPLSKRKYIDKLFLDLLKKNGVTFLRRWCFYLAVRWFGKKAAQP